MDKFEPQQDLDEAFFEDSSGATPSVAKNLVEGLWDELMVPRRTNTDIVGST